MKRIHEYYGPLKALARMRDTDCWGAYVKYLARPLMGDRGSMEPPADDDRSLVLHHVDRRAGLASRDREDNVVTLTPEMHHMVHEPGKEETRKKIIRAYLHSEEVEEWRAMHVEEIRAAENTREAALLKEKRKRCAAR